MEYINKAELIKECNYTVCLEDDEETFGISEARIDLMPTIDIVTCSECIHRLCRRNCGGRRPDWFCADGEREVTE